MLAEAAQDRQEVVAPWYVPHAAQRRMHAAAAGGARFVTVCAGRRSGKTLSCAVEVVSRAFRDKAAGRGKTVTDPDLPPFVREPSLVYWVVAPQSSLYHVALRHVLRALPENVRRLFAKDNDIAGMLRSPYPRLWLPSDILIEFRSAEHPDALVSEGLDGLWLTEAARIDPMAWEGNLRPALADRRGWVMSDSTPQGRNWWWEQFWRRGDQADAKADAGYCNVAWSTLANSPPTGNADLEWARVARQLAEEVTWARANMDPVRFRREYEASFDAFVGQVYELDEARHRFAGPVGRSQYKRVIAGYDWGRHSPGCLVVVGERHGREGYDVVAEVYESGLLPDSWVGRIKAACATWGIATIWCDPSTPILPLFRDRGLPVQENAIKSVVEGIEVVARFATARGSEPPRLRVHASCANTWRELTGYRWQEQAAGRGDVPLKKDDHACDALRYAIASDARGVGVWPLR